MKTSDPLAASNDSKKDLDLLLIAAAKNPKGEAQDENGLTQTVAELLDRGADVNAESDGITALIIAAYNGYTENVSALLSCDGINVNAKISDGFTALMIAARNGHAKIVDELLARGAAVNAKTSDDVTALMIAAQNGHTEIVDKLLVQKADVNAKISDDVTVLMVAAEKGHTEIVDKLLARGAAVNAKRSDGFTALMIAAQNGHTKTVDKLLDKGADVNAATTDGTTALMFAAKNGHTKTVAKLLDEGADVTAESDDGLTALMFAAKNGHTKTVDKLLARRAAVNAKAFHGFTALMFAAQEGHTETVAVLLAQGAYVNASQSDGVTALILAARDGHTEIVSVLLAQRAYVNAESGDSLTALMFAAKNGHTEIVSTLLKTLSKTTDEEVRRHVAREIISIASTPAGQELLATEETKTALLKILSETTDGDVKGRLRPLIKDITILIPQLQLEAAIKSYKTINPDKSVPRPRAIKTLLGRFLTEEIGPRRESQQEPIEETLEKIATSTKPILEAFVQKPNHLKWADEIAKAYLDGCINQPVAGWLEISAWLPIAQAPKTIDKIEASKHLMVLEKMNNYIIEKLAKEAELRRAAGEVVHSTMAGVEIEAGNALFREVHKKLLLNRDISKPWLGVPNSIAYELTITTWLTKEKIEEAYEEAKATLRQKSEEVANYLAKSHHSGTWGLVAFPQELEEIDKKYAGRMESLSGNSAEDLKEMISLAKEKEAAVIKAIIDLSEASFKDRGKGAKAAAEDIPSGRLSLSSSESLGVLAKKAKVAPRAV